jgi:hypothetical protein
MAELVHGSQILGCMNCLNVYYFPPYNVETSLVVEKIQVQVT